MEMNEVRYFLALCEERNFTRAAKRCGVSQPSLTNGIKRLEAEFGGPLLDRSRKPSRLTELGRIVQPYLAGMDLFVLDAKRLAAEFLISSPGMHLDKAQPQIEPEK